MHGMYGTVAMNELKVFAPKGLRHKHEQYYKLSIVMGVKSKVSHYHNLYERTDLGPMNNKKKMHIELSRVSIALYISRMFVYIRGKITNFTRRDTITAPPPLWPLFMEQMINCWYCLMMMIAWL